MQDMDWYRAEVLFGRNSWAYLFAEMRRNLMCAKEWVYCHLTQEGRDRTAWQQAVFQYYLRNNWCDPVDWMDIDVEQIDNMWACTLKTDMMYTIEKVLLPLLEDLHLSLYRMY